MGPTWIAAVRRGEFEAIPEPFRWEESLHFAHLIPGYELAGGVLGCAALSEQLVFHYRSTGDWVGSPLDLWIALFFEHRACRHSGCTIEDLELPLYDSLCEALRCKLVGLPKPERDELVRRFRPDTVG